MLANGQAAVVKIALASMPDARIDRYAAPLLLGAMRVDVARIPLLNRVYEHMSLNHFYRRGLPGGFVPFVTRGVRASARNWFAAALDEQRNGRTTAAFVRLGGVSHLIADMSCPVHVHRVIHESDSFEWYVEAHHQELRALPVPAVPEFDRAEDVIESLASITKTFEPDRTRYSLGRLLCRAGLRRAVPRQVIAEQARTLLPLAGAHTAAMLRLFLRETRA
ncbi:MAG TPA: zinc dependent phospholipase C family protein [Thermoanaerobaculia bacterium]